MKATSMKAAGETTARRVWKKRQQMKQPNPKRPWLMSSVVALLLILGIGTGSTLTFEQLFSSRIYPNITVNGVPVGALTSAEASTALHARYADFLHNPVTLHYDEHTWQPTLADLGIQLHTSDAAQQALAAGRHANHEETLRSVAAIGTHGWDVPLRLTVDEAALQQYLVNTLSVLNQSPIDAQFLMNGTTLTVTPSAYGQQVLIDATVEDIIATVQSLEHQTVTIRTRPLAPLLDDARVTEAHDTVHHLLHKPLLLTAGEHAWEWDSSDLAKLIHVQRTSDAATAHDSLQVSLDAELIRQRLTTYADATEVPGVYPRVDWNGGTPVIFRQGQPGARINVDQATELLMETLWSDNRSLELPFKDVPVPSTSEDLAQLGLREVISVGRSSFEDSEEYRVTNIVAGMRLLHGVLLAPGDEFSFNETIQSIGPENGFVQGYAIVDERTQLEWGGGICQDSTTMMRAAFWAGLPLTERWNHSRYLNWYDEYGYGAYGDGPGIDSTIFLGGPDLRFVNDTPAWILIQAYANTETEVAEIVFFGTKGNRVVELAGPRISYLPDGRMEVAFTRIVREGDIEVRRTTYWSTYE